jgi:hypothetical protein
VLSKAHNIYLQLLAAGGLIAFASFMIYCSGLVTAAWRAMSGPRRDEAAAAIVVIFVWLVEGFFDTLVADKFLYVVPGLLLAISRLAPPVGVSDMAGPAAAIERFGGRMSSSGRLKPPAKPPVGTQVTAVSVGTRQESHMGKQPTRPR